MHITATTLAIPTQKFLSIEVEIVGDLQNTGRLKTQVLTLYERLYSWDTGINIHLITGPDVRAYLLVVYKVTLIL